MSTDFESIKLSEHSNILHITRFYGGKERGTCVQLTPQTPHNYLVADEDGAKKLIEQLSLAFELPTITRLEADKARLVEALADATETIRQMAEADRRQIQKLTEWKRRQSDIDALVKRSNEVKK